MRTPIYAWGTGGYRGREGTVHLWVRKGHEVAELFDPEDFEGFSEGIAMDQSVFDALVLMRAAQLVRPSGKADLKRAIRHASKNCGNLGAHALKELLQKATEEAQ